MKAKVYDIIGISAAGLCLIHCAIFPVLLLLPMGLSHNPYIDLLFLVFGIPVVIKTTKTVQQLWLKYVFWISLILICVSVLGDLILHIHLPLIYLGAVGLITAHSINYKNHKH